MKKKIKTTPLQREILWALADPGECSLPALLNSLLPKFPHLSPASLLKEVERSLVVLYRGGCLYLMREIGGERKEFLYPEMFALNLGRTLSWKEGEGGFVVSEDNVDDVVVQLTTGGVYWLELIAAQSDHPVSVWKPRQ